MTYSRTYRAGSAVRYRSEKVISRLVVVTSAATDVRRTTAEQQITVTNWTHFTDKKTKIRSSASRNEARFPSVKSVRSVALLLFLLF
jgi:hypothetical protein